MIEFEETSTPDETGVEEVVETEEEKEVETEVKDEEKPVNKTKKYIDKLRSEKFDALREAEYYRNKAKELTPSEKEEAAFETPARPARPAMEAFEDDLGNLDTKKYNEALINYEDNLFAWKEESRNHREYEARQKDRMEKARVNFKEQQNKVSEKHDDFHEVAFAEDVPYDEDGVMAQQVMESEYGAEIAYYLGKHTDYALKMSKLPPEKVIKEVGKLEAKFSMPERKSVSQATEPITPVGGNDAGVIMDPSKIKDDDEWYQNYKKDQARKFRNRERI